MIPVMVGYDGALPKFLGFVLDDKVTVSFHAVARPGNAVTK
jgi:hypothetical protein